MKNAGLAALQEKQFLGNLIICHDSHNKKQLKQLLSIMSLLIKNVDNQEFESIQLKAVSGKVDNSDLSYITWMRDRILLMKNNQLKQTIMKTIMFNNSSLYKGISQEGLKVLLSILLLFNCNDK